MYTATAKDDVKNASNSIQNGANEAKHDLRDAANKAGRTVRSYFDSAYDEITRDTQTVTTQIRQNPVQSSVIALGLGIVLGALFRR